MSRLKKHIYCTLAILISMGVIGVYSAYITKKIIFERSFQSHILSELLDLQKLQVNQVDDLLYEKSISMFGSISKLNQDSYNSKRIKLICQELNEIDINAIIIEVEKKIHLSNEEKNNFFVKVKQLQHICR